MAEVDSYFETLSGEDQAAIELVLEPSVIAGIREGQVSEQESAAISRVDQLILNAPKLTEDVLIYKVITGDLAEGVSIDDVKKGGEITEPAFFAAATVEPTHDEDPTTTTLQIVVPREEPAIAIPSVGYILMRGRVISLDPVDEETGIQHGEILGSEDDFIDEEPVEETPAPVEDEVVASGLIRLIIQNADATVEDEAVTASGHIRLIGEAIHEFYNAYHDPKSGRFGDTGPAGPNPRKRAGEGGAPGEKQPLKFAPIEKDLDEKFGAGTSHKIRAAGNDPKDYEYRNKAGELTGKPLPGTKSWQNDHGIDEAVWNSRPNIRWKNSKDPIFDEHYGGDLDPSNKRSARVIASKEEGFIMVRKPLPGAKEAGFGDIPPQTRPDFPIVNDQRRRATKARELEQAKIRSDQVNNWKPEDVIAERRTLLAKAKADEKKFASQDPQFIKQVAYLNRDKAAAEVKKAVASGNEERIVKAKIAHKIADNEAKSIAKDVNLAQKDPGRARALLRQEVQSRQAKLDRALADPEGTLKSVQDYSRNQIGIKQKQFDKTAIKYVFPGGEGNASRLEANQDKQNIKNLTQGKGRVYFVMEGNIKADSVLSRVKKEDPKAAVVSVPSVTAWNEKEVAWASQKYFKGRDVILIPDADGLDNKNVLQQAKKMRGLLTNEGTKSVTMASPPRLPGRNANAKSKIEYIELPTGKLEGRKGIDDHLGVGKGTLGDLQYGDGARPKFDLSDVARQNKIRSHAVPNMNRTLEAVSDLSGEDGFGRVSSKSIAQYSRIPESTIKGKSGSLSQLEKAGIIKRYDVFEPGALGHGRRVQALPTQEIKRITRLSGVPMPDLDTKFVDDSNKWETAPIYEIVNKQYVTKNGATKTLASKFTSLQTSKRQQPSSKIAAKKPSKPGVRLVRTAEGARRYGVSIGQPIPEGPVVASGEVKLTIKDTGIKLVPQPVTFDQITLVTQEEE